MNDRLTPRKFPALTLGCAIALSACASTANDYGGAAAAGGKLAPPTAAKLVMKVPAIGVQIYKCAVTDGKYTWAFVAPDADLFDERGKLIGRHGAGPFWELADGSKVNGAVAQREDAKRPGAIPHLLLSTKSTGGAGAIASVKHLQRLNTIGGVAPATGCAAAQDVDKQARIYYTADYYLFGEG